MVLLICTGIYWFFLKDSHKKDSTITAAAFCLCSEKYSKNLDSVYQVFIDSFPSYSFPGRHEATDKLKRLTNPSELIYEKCKSEATLNYTKFKARYIMDPDKLRLFEQEFEQQQLKCAYTEELPESPLLVEIDKIIRSIGYPPSDSTYINHAFDEGNQPTEGTGYVKTKEGSDLRLRREPSENADIITLTSSSTVTNAIKLFGKNQIKKIPILISIGPITTNTLKENDLSPTIEAAISDIDGVVKAILESVSNG